MDSISIQGLSVQTVIGVYDWERVESRELLIDVVFSCDLQQASETDDVLHTIDYAEVADCIQRVASESQFQLLEALAGALFKALFKRFPASHIVLTIHKPNILPDAKDVAITMKRQRS
ncbi:dihydroneopterin aldolase [Alteromonadaceae bacterium M269]|nr:dihydroneopterin aldolase [Alteromonadaceae bacterium M269]